MLELGVVQFFSPRALFLMWNYLKPLITRSFIVGDTINLGRPKPGPAFSMQFILSALV